MQLNSAMSEARLRDALMRDALDTWGADRLPVLESRIDATARMIWLVLQLPLTSLDDEPDFPGRPLTLPAGS